MSHTSLLEILDDRSDLIDINQQIGIGGDGGPLPPAALCLIAVQNGRHLAIDQCAFALEQDANIGVGVVKYDLHFGADILLPLHVHVQTVLVEFRGGLEICNNNLTKIKCKIMIQ